MGLADALAAEKQASRGGVVCSICALERTLDPEELAVFKDALADPSIPSTAIARALAVEGHKANGASLARHRRGECKNR